MFQSTLPYGERPHARAKVIKWQVSIHAPVRGATFCQPFVLTPNHRFNPRSRTGSDGTAFPLCSQFDVSIHAPVRGATVRLIVFFSQFKVSIHAPVRGATIFGGVEPGGIKVSIHAPVRGATAVLIFSLLLIAKFQSTLPYGERRKFTHGPVVFIQFQSTLPYGERP